MKICIDLDGVLVDIMPEIKERLNRDFHLEIDSDEISKIDLAEILKTKGVRYQYLIRLFDDEWFWSRGRAVDENISYLRKWKQEGHEIYLVTARPHEMGMATSAWLRRQDVPYNKLMHKKQMHKYEYLLEIEADCIFEDTFYEANRCATEGIPAFVLRHPYNAKFEERTTNSLITWINTFAEADDWVKQRLP